jgi:predicted nucleic acid-binding protein
MVCLDTSVLVSIIRKNRSALEKLRAESDEGNAVSTTVINLCELYSGAYGSRNHERELERVGSVVATLRILGLGSEASRKYGELLNDESLKKNPIGDFDLLIS